ncbi:MAG: type II secretion system F family protein [Candidatus Peregrinibacteria bacterium]
MSDFQISAAQKQFVTKASNGTENMSFFDKINEWVIDMSPVSMKSKVIFYRLLSTMINAGVSMVKAMNILANQFEDPKMKKVCRIVLSRIEKGMALSDALQEYPETFTEAELGMISSGEVSGRLNGVLIDLADRVESGAKISGKIKGAMMYPMAIIIILVIVVSAVMVLVIPKLKETFEKGGAELPAATQLLIDGSDFITGSTMGIPNAILMILTVVGIIFGIKTWKKTPEGMFHWDNLMLNLPVFGGMNRKLVLLQFCQSLASLISSGVSITKTLQITSQVVGNEVYRRRILLIGEDVKQGIPIADNIRENNVMFPIMLTSMIDIGEKTAQLNKVCLKVAEFYQDELDTTVKTLSSLMEPIIIVVIGGVVGFIVTAIMSPIMKLSDVASGG